MRTTVTLDSDTVELLQRRMQERHVSFKVALNDAIREGLARPSGARRYRTPTSDLGLPTVNLDRALQLAAELEDEELIRKQRVGK
jgi:hypothetical protein